ncbi:MAG: hypothetical protein OCD02_12270 [Spirochaetaceae bacterium]
MYKDLSSSLKTFSPSELETAQIVNNFLNHNFIHSGDNLHGEEYEAWIYEYLKSWAVQNSDVSKFLIKDGSKKIVSNKDGLNFDKNGQIVYFKAGIKVAEYDCLFVYKGKIIFVECSVSDLRSYYRRLEDKIIVKRNYLVDLYNTEEVYYLVVTKPKKRSITYRSLPHLVLYKLKNPEFSTLKKTDQVFNTKSEKLVTISSFSSSSF